MYSTGYIEQHESLCIGRNVFFSLNAGLNIFFYGQHLRQSVYAILFSALWAGANTHCVSEEKSGVQGV